MAGRCTACWPGISELLLLLLFTIIIAFCAQNKTRLFLINSNLRKLLSMIKMNKLQTKLLLELPRGSQHSSICYHCPLSTGNHPSILITIILIMIKIYKLGKHVQIMRQIF